MHASAPPAMPASAPAEGGPFGGLPAGDPALAAPAPKGPSGALDAPDPDAQLRMRATADTFLRLGFLGLLKMAFPEKYPLASLKHPAPENLNQALNRAALLADIAHASGFSVLGADMNYPPDPDDQQRHAAFCAKHNLAPGTDVMVFHGTDAAASKSISERGFDPARARTFMYGKGSAYVANSIDAALPYAPPDPEGRVYVNYGWAHLPDARDVPVGAKDQDPGVLASGREVLATRNEAGSYICLRYPEQFRPEGRLVFKIDTAVEPQDFALEHMLFPPPVWRALKANFPGIVARKQALVRRTRARSDAVRRALRRLARQGRWSRRVGKRAPAPRAARAAKVARFKPYWS